MHPRMYVGGVGEWGGEGWQKWTVASSTSRAAMSLGEQGRGERKGSTFVHVRLKFSVGFE